MAAASAVELIMVAKENGQSSDGPTRRGAAGSKRDAHVLLLDGGGISN